MSNEMMEINELGYLDWDFDEMVPSHQKDFALNFLLKLYRKILDWGNVIYSGGEVVYGDPNFIPPKLEEIAKRLSIKYGEVELIRAPGENDRSVRIKIAVSQRTAERIRRPILFIISLVSEINRWANK